MPQPRRSSQGKRGGAARSGAAKKATRRPPSKPSGAGKPAGRAKPGKPPRRGKATSRPPVKRAKSDEVSAKTVAELREALSASLTDPLELVMLTRDRIEEALADAVTRGRVTADDAQELVSGLLERGRRQTNDVLGDLEGLLARGRNEIEGRAGTARKRGSDAARRARRQVEEATARARKETAKQADPVSAKVDQARRGGGIGSSFPITAYDDLTAAQVQGRLGGLSPAELRKVRDYERRHANRKTVLKSIAEKIGG